MRKNPRTFNIEVGLLKQLDIWKGSSKTNVVNEALRLYFSGKSVSDYFYRKRLDDIEGEKNQILSILSLKDEERVKLEEKGKSEQDRIEKEFYRFKKRIDAALRDGSCEVKGINDVFGLKLNDDSLRGVISRYQKGDFSFKDFMNLKEG